MLSSASGAVVNARFAANAGWPANGRLIRAGSADSLVSGNAMYEQVPYNRHMYPRMYTPLPLLLALILSALPFLRLVCLCMIPWKAESWFLRAVFCERITYKNVARALFHTIFFWYNFKDEQNFHINQIWAINRSPLASSSSLDSLFKRWKLLTYALIYFCLC